MGGPIRKDRIFFYAGFDQHLLTVPSMMQFANGATAIVPQPIDYDYLDKPLVMAAAQQLNSMGGYYPTTMQGNAGFAKLDFTLSPKQLAFLRISTSRFSGNNNEFFDPSSPVTGYAESGNGSQSVKTESVAASLTSAWTNSLATNLRLQFSRDVQQAAANSDQPWTKIYDVIAGFGGSDMLPQDTREHKFFAGETLSYETSRVHWKFGGDFIQNWVYDYYPYLFGGEYYFDDVKVNPWTFAPMKYGEPLTPLRAYAHDVPRYYMQDFGNPVSHPNSRLYSAFMQDTFRITRNFTLNAGLRWDLQTFEPGKLASNPLYAPSGKVPTDLNNFSPRLGFAYSRWPESYPGDSRRRGRFLHAHSGDVCVAGRQRQWHPAKPAFPGLDGSSAGRPVPHLSQSAGELSAGNRDLQSTGFAGRTGDHADFRLRAQLPDSLHRAGHARHAARVWRQDRGHGEL